MATHSPLRVDAPDTFEAFDELSFMTFQTAMIGTDGLVVASDRLQIYLQPETDNELRSTQATSVCKFIKNSTETVICAHAGGPYSEEMARTIAIKSRPDLVPDINSWKDHVLEIVTDVPRSGGRVTDEIIVVRRDSSDCIVVTRHSTLEPAAMTLNDRLCTGINTVSRFLPHHFWQRLPVENLKHLALLSVAFAAMEKKDSVGAGIDLLLVRNKKAFWEHYAEDDATLARAVEDFKEHNLEGLFRHSR